MPKAEAVEAWLVTDRYYRQSRLNGPLRRGRPKRLLVNGAEVVGTMFDGSTRFARRSGLALSSVVLACLGRDSWQWTMRIGA
jgi:hypothetical protein